MQLRLHCRNFLSAFSHASLSLCLPSPSLPSPPPLSFSMSLPLSPLLPAGTHSVPGTSASYTLSADVGLLTRNIKVIGQDYPQLFEESFGARVLVGAYSWEGIDYKGTHRTPGIRQTLLNILITVSFVIFSPLICDVHCSF